MLNQMQKKNRILGWPYWLGALLLSGLNIALFASTGSPWSITTTITYWGAYIFQTIGGSPESWLFFLERPMLFKSSPLLYHGTWLNLGLMYGALLSSLFSSQLRVRKTRSRKMWLGALLGGILMGYGARLSLGCNIGALIGGIASMSFHGWVFGVFVAVGAYLGSKILLHLYQ